MCKSAQWPISGCKVGYLRTPQQRQPQDNVHVNASFCICPACLCLANICTQKLSNIYLRATCNLVCSEAGETKRLRKDTRRLSPQRTPPLKAQRQVLSDRRVILSSRLLLSSSTRTRLYPSVAFGTSRVVTDSFSFSPLGTCLSLSPPIGLIISVGRLLFIGFGQFAVLHLLATE